MNLYKILRESKRNNSVTTPEKFGWRNEGLLETKEDLERKSLREDDFRVKPVKSSNWKLDSTSNRFKSSMASNEQLTEEEKENKGIVPSESIFIDEETLNVYFDDYLIGKAETSGFDEDNNITYEVTLNDRGEMLTNDKDLYNWIKQSLSFNMQDPSLASNVKIVIKKEEDLSSIDSLYKEYRKSSSRKSYKESEDRYYGGKQPQGSLKDFLKDDFFESNSSPYEEGIHVLENKLCRVVYDEEAGEVSFIAKGKNKFTREREKRVVATVPKAIFSDVTYKVVLISEKDSYIQFEKLNLLSSKNIWGFRYRLNPDEYDFIVCRYAFDVL